MNARRLILIALATLCAAAGELSSWSGQALATEPVTSGLPDGRGYELVSAVTPTQDNSVYLPESGDTTDNIPYGGVATDHPFEAAPDGEAIAYIDSPGPSGGDGRLAIGGGNEFLGTRSPAGGWTSVNTTPSASTAVEFPEVKYIAFFERSLGGGAEHRGTRISVGAGAVRLREPLC